MPGSVTERAARPTRQQAAAQQARDLIHFADGAEEAGLIQYARLVRSLARETIWLADQLDTEQSARVAIQKQRDECLRILANHAGQAAA